MHFTYNHGETCANSAIRVLKSDCGRIGKVTRSRGSLELGYGNQRVSFFAWDDPDTEYPTIEAAIAAASH